MVVGKLFKPYHTQIGEDRWIAIAASEYQFIAIKKDGTLWNNGNTQIGTDNTWSKIAAGGHHSLAIKNDGTLWSWGYNYYGQLGLGHTTYSVSTPSKVGTGRSWIDVDGGDGFSIGLYGSYIYTWGENNNGQLGRDTNGGDSPNPSRIASGFYTGSSIAAGGYHSLMLKNNGTLYGCGYNGWGQLGLGDRDNRLSLTLIGSDWSKISAGYYHTLAIKNDGTLWSWGKGISNIPIKNGTDTWVAIAAGNGQSIVLTELIPNTIDSISYNIIDE
jgi:hypothetical protein